MWGEGREALEGVEDKCCQLLWFKEKTKKWYKLDS